MTEDHAAAIWDFVEAHRSDVKTIVVNCNHGYCRSPAVATEIAFGDEQYELLRGAE